MHHRIRQHENAPCGMDYLCRGAALPRPYCPDFHLIAASHSSLTHYPLPPALPRSRLGNNNINVAETNNEAPATAKPPYKLPVFWLIHPVAYGPANPPRFASELTRAIPEAAANPVRKSPGSE